MTFLGLDVATSSTKALLIDEDGNVAGVASSAYETQTPEPLWSEQDPADWWTAAQESIRTVLSESNTAPEAVDAVGLTGQMHGLVLLDERGAVLRPAILWNDQRTGAECDAMREALGKERLVQLTGNDALPGFTAPKLLWVREHEPDVYARAAQALLPKDYVRFKLTGQYATDKAGAAGTILFDLEARDWSAEVLEALELDPGWLPPTHEGTDVMGEISGKAAEATGLAEGTPVVAGGGDQSAAAVGTGAVEEGVVSISLGTSGVVFAATGRPAVESEGRLHAFCHAAPGTWHLMGVMLSAAGSLRWYRDTLAPKTDFDDLLAPAADVPAGSDGLFFLPYLTGERTPHPDPQARGGFIGLTARHEQPHLTRAVLEGVAFGLRDNFELMQDAGLARVDEARITGGGTQSALWRQIIADALGVELATVANPEGAAYGAALLAGVGAGGWPSVEAACAEVVRVTERTAPRPEPVSVYDERHALYQELYPALRSVFHEVAQ
jgi:xylulokinase